MSHANPHEKSRDKIVIYGHQASRASRPYWLLREYGMQINEDFIEVDTGGPGVLS